MRGALILVVLLAGCNTLTTSVLTPNLRQNFVAGAPEACAFEGQVHALSAAEDLGGGFVAQFREDAPSSDGPEDFSNWRLTSCQSNQTLALGVFNNTTIAGESFDDRALFAEFRVQLRAASEPLTLDGIAEQAEEAGLRVSRAAELTETCGCAALYPEMLGSQTPSSFRDIR